MREASHTTIQESNAIEVESRPKGDTENIESEKTQLSQDMPSIQPTEKNRQEHAAFNIETKIESKEDEDKDEADDKREKGLPAIGLPRNEFS